MDKEDPMDGELFQRQKAWFVNIFNRIPGVKYLPNVYYYIVGIVGFVLLFGLFYNYFTDKNFSQFFTHKELSDERVISDSVSEVSDEESELDTDCNVIKINIIRGIDTYESNSDMPMTTSEDVANMIEYADARDNVKMILLSIDSGGGSPVAGEEIMNALINSSKPSVALIRQIGASAAYWSAVGASHIIASKNSDVGSIGVTSSYLQNTRKNSNDGYDYISLSTGIFKDSGSPDKPITQTERKMILKDLNTILNNFIANISERRKIPESKVREIADGSTFLGERALELGLIDETGGIKEAKDYIESIIGEGVDICQ